MRNHLSDAFAIAEGMDDYAFGAEIQQEADRSIEWASLWPWFDGHRWDIEWVCGKYAMHKFSLEQLWACMYHAEKVTPLGSSKWFKSRARRFTALPE